MQGGATHLFIASQNGHLEVVCLLFDAGADKDIADQGDATPLLVASTREWRHPALRCRCRPLHENNENNKTTKTMKTMKNNENN